MIHTETATASDAYLREARAAYDAAMPDHLDRLGWDGERIAALQRQRLRALVAHAQRCSPFHARRLSGIDPEQLELSDLGAIPPMTKADLMASFDEVVTDSRANLAAVEAAVAATGTDPVPIGGELVVLASGGSSGERGLFVYSTAALAEFGLSITRPMRARLEALGGPPPGGLDIALVAARSPLHATGCGARLLQGGPVRFASIPVTLPLEEIVARLNALQPPALLSYPSMLTQLAHEQAAGRLHIAPQSVTAASETLLADHRRAIRAAFGVPLVNTYGATEGLAGASAPDDDVITFASDCCIVEPVDEHDRPVPAGTASAAVLVTNLFNHVQPLIRYRLDDRFVQHAPVPGHGHFRAEVHGRTTDLLEFAGTVVHPLVLASPLGRVPEITDFQVRQLANGVEVDVVAPQGVAVTPLGAELTAALRDAGLVDPQVRVGIVDAIARHPETGKRQQFVPRLVGR
jgi:phenylacetate-coenzyme A ligase PaaK-like adenylate-forming protein